MTVLESELKMYKAEVNNDTDANGGRCSTDLVTTGAAQNVFPHVFKSERTSGVTRRRKVFYRNENDNDETAYNGQPFFHHPPGGDHYLFWHEGTFSDTQADITGSERKYGSALLSTAATAGSSTLVVTCKHASQTAMFADGDPIMVSNKSTPSSGTGTEEAHVISGTPVVAGLQVTITLAGTLANSYAVDVTSVSSGATAADIACTISGWTDSASRYDETTYPVICDNIGTVYDRFVVTYNGSGGFTVVGDREGNLPSGTTGSDYSPPNANKSNKPFFTLEAAGHAGTEQAGDQLIFYTNPAEIAVWETLTVPAGADPIGNGGFYSYLDCETA